MTAGSASTRVVAATSATGTNAQRDVMQEQTRRKRKVEPDTRPSPSKTKLEAQGAHQVGADQHEGCEGGQQPDALRAQASCDTAVGAGSEAAACVMSCASACATAATAEGRLVCDATWHGSQAVAAFYAKAWQPQGTLAHAAHLSHTNKQVLR